MKKLTFILLGICMEWVTNAQTDSLNSYINMSFEDLLKVKVTTAGKSEQQVKDIPASVVIITRADIEAHGYHSLSEILENIPGMYMTNDYTVGGANFGVRGYWSVIPNNNLMIFVNDVDQINLPYASYQLDYIALPVEAIERIEVIRGPMSVLYGSGAFFGVINIFTKNLSQTNIPTSLVVGSAGTQHSGRAMLRVANRMKDFSYSLNTSVYTSSGIDQPYSKMNDNTSLFKTSSTKDLLKRQELYFGFNAKMKNFYSDFSFNESKIGMMFLFPSAGNGSYGNVRSTILTVGYKNLIRKKWDIDGKLTYYNQFQKTYYDAFFPNAYEYQDLPSKAWDADFTVNSDLSKKIHFTAGAKFRSILNIENNMHLPTNGFGFYYNTTQTIDDNSQIDSWAGFTQIDYQPLSKLKIIAGGRIEQSLDYKLKTIIADTLFGVPADIIRETYAHHDVQFIPRLAAVYSFNSGNIVKFMYGKAINTPSWFQIINGGPHHLNQSFQYIQSYEINYIAVPGPKWLINSSIFYNRLNDLIVRTVGVDSQGKFYNYNSNAGKVDSKGIEITLQIKPNEKMDVELSGMYQKSLDLNDQDLIYSYSPNKLGNLKVSYRINPKAEISFIGNYVDKMETDWLANPDGTGSRIGKTAPSYFTLGANIKISDLFIHDLYLEIHGTDIFNQDVLYPATTNNYTIFPKGTIGIGRQVIFTLGYKFHE